MHFRITADYDIESGLGPLVDVLSGPTRRHFASREYGSDLLGLVIVLICQDPSLKLRQRIRMSTKEHKLYLDIMMDLDQMRRSDSKTRMKIVSERIIETIPTILGKYGLKQFDELRFTGDLKNWFTKLN